MEAGGVLRGGGLEKYRRPVNCIILLVVMVIVIIHPPPHQDPLPPSHFRSLHSLLYHFFFFEGLRREKEDYRLRELSSDICSFSLDIFFFWYGLISLFRKGNVFLYFFSSFLFVPNHLIFQSFSLILSMSVKFIKCLISYY